MADLTSWAPLATGGAALIGALVTWALGASRNQRLRFAIEVADKIPLEQREDWTHMIFRDAERIMERARLPGWVFPCYVIGWSAIVVSMPLPGTWRWWALVFGLAFAVPSTAKMIVSHYQEKRVLQRRTERRSAVIAASKAASEAQVERMRVEIAQQESELAAMTEEEDELRDELRDMHTMISIAREVAIETFMDAGATRRQATAAASADLDNDEVRREAGLALLKRSMESPAGRARRWLRGRRPEQPKELDPHRAALRRRVVEDLMAPPGNGN